MLAPGRHASAKWAWSPSDGTYVLMEHGRPLIYARPPSDFVVGVEWEYREAHDDHWVGGLPPEIEPPPIKDALRAAGLRNVVRAFLLEERDAGRVTSDQWADLLRDLLPWRPHEFRPARAAAAPTPLAPSAPTVPPPPVVREAPAPRPVTVAPVAPATPTRVPTPHRGVAPRPPRAAAARPPERAPRTSRLRTFISEWWAAHRVKIGRDIAVHGLSYLGVLLLFVAPVGFMIFSFSSVSARFRPLAEAIFASTFFGASWMLGRKGPSVVGRSLEFLGGLLVPVVAIAMWVDGAPFPPDRTGVPLIAWMSGQSMVLAGVYVLVARWRPSSTLRLLVAPVAWLGVACAGLLTVSPIPSGRAVANPVPWQWAMVAATVAVTLAALRRFATSAWARAIGASGAPAAALAGLLVILSSPQFGWEVGPLALAGVSLTVVAELLYARRAPRATTATQFVVVVVFAACLYPALGYAWASAVAASCLLGLAEWQAWRRPDPQLLTVLVVAAAVLAAFSIREPSPLLFVASIGAVWSVGRRRWPLAGLPSIVPIVGLVIFPLALVVSLSHFVALDVTLAIASGVVLATAVVVRFTTMRSDEVFATWVPTAALSLVAAVDLTGSGRWWLSVATAGTVAVALVVAPTVMTVRVWSVFASLASVLAWVAIGNDLSVPQTTIVASAVGVLAVGGSLLGRTALGAHVGVAGLSAVTAAEVVVVLDSGWHMSESATGFTVIALACLAASWCAVAVVGEWRGCAVRDLLVGLQRWQPGTYREWSPDKEEAEEQFAGPAIAAVALLALAALPPVVVIWRGALAATSPWLAVIAGGVAAGAVAPSRVLFRARPLLVRVCAGLAVMILVALTSLVAAPLDGATAASAGLVVAAVVAIGPSARGRWMLWLGWSASALATVATAHEAHVDSSSLHLVVLAWGVAALTGSLGLDDVLEGRRRAGDWVRRAQLFPGATLGAIVIPLALAPVYADAPTTWGWWSLGVAAAVLAVAWQVRLGAVSLLSWLLAAAAYGALVPWDPSSLPWTWVPVVAVMLAAAEVVRRVAAPVAAPVTRGRLVAWLARWDTPALVGAHLVAVGSLALAVVVGWIPATWIATGVLALALSALRRRWEWGAAGVVLVLTGTGVAGMGWLALALTVVGVGSTVAAIRAREWLRTGLQFTGSLALGGAWAATGAWQSWDAARTTVAAASASAAILAVLAVATRWARLGQDWLVAWFWLPVVGLGIDVRLLAEPAVHRSSAQFVVAGAVAVAAAAAALLAGPTRLGWLRESSVVLLAGAVGLAADASTWRGSATVDVAVCAAVSLAATGVALGLQVTGRAPPWRRPALLLAGLASAVSFGEAARTWPERPLMVAALLALGVNFAGLAAVLRRVEWGILCSVTLIAAWLVYASEALTGNAQWFTVPVGVWLLIVVELMRSDLRRRGRPVAPVTVVVLELVAMAFVVAASFVQAFTISTLYALLAAGEGVALGVFAVLTRVRRRLAVGVVTVVAALVCMLVPPLVGLAPRLHGWVPWALMFAAGLLAVSIAAFLEQARRLTRASLRRVRELTAGWE